MSTHDPFLRYWLNVLDRALVWLTLSLGCSAVIWSVAWQRGLQQPALNGWRLLYTLLTSQAIDRPSLTILALSTGSGLLLATLLSAWLFRRWTRQGELRHHHLRGSRLEV
jgi:hypothetical protein